MQLSLLQRLPPPPLWELRVDGGRNLTSRYVSHTHTHTRSSRWSGITKGQVSAAGEKTSEGRKSLVTYFEQGKWWRERKRKEVAVVRVTLNYWRKVSVGGSHNAFCSFSAWLEQVGKSTKHKLKHTVVSEVTFGTKWWWIRWNFCSVFMKSMFLCIDFQEKDSHYFIHFTDKNKFIHLHRINHKKVDFRQVFFILWLHFSF